MSYNTRTNAYRSSNSEIIAGPGTMYNEITRPRSSAKQYNTNTNTYAVTAPHVKVSKSKSINTGISKSKNRKNNRK